jgi:acyl dehydratase
MATTTHGRAVSAELFARDFDEIEPGMRFRTRGRTITDADVVGFGTLTGDLHPVHTDAEWAGDSIFGERIAHGMLVLSYAVGLVPLSPERVLALRRIRDATFKAPARLGDTISVEGEVADVKTLDDRVGQVSCKWKIVDQDQRTLVRATIEVLWRREPVRRSNGHVGTTEMMTLARRGAALTVDGDILTSGDLLF